MAGPPVLVAFHCMESARRGPRCAKRLELAIAAATEAVAKPLPALEIRILAGGFDQWIRRFWQDPEKVTGYDDAYWGYAGAGPGEGRAHAL